MKLKKQELYNSIKKDAREYLKKGFKTEVDAHIHTTFSDGMFDIFDIIILSRISGIKKIVITDHNTIYPGYLEVQKLKENFSPDNISISVGCEIACKIIDDKTRKPVPIEMLAYNVDPVILQSFIDMYKFNNNVSQEEQLSFFTKMCEKHNLTFSKELTVPKGTFATEVLCKELLKHEENKDFFMKTHPIVWNSPKLFYKKFVANPQSDFYLDTTDHLPNYIDTINAIIAAKGVPILAHPFLYIYEEVNEVKALMDKVLYTSDIAGFEAYHSTHTIEEREFISSYAAKHGKLVSGGTDFHSGPETILGFGRKNALLELKLDMFSWIK